MHEMFCRRQHVLLFGTGPKSTAGYQSHPRLFDEKSIGCEGTRKMASNAYSVRCVKPVLSYFFSVGVAKLHLPKKVLNQNGLFDFASVESAAKSFCKALFLKKALAAALHIERRYR
jgi:hypothetical protein